MVLDCRMDRPGSKGFRVPFGLTEGNTLIDPDNAVPKGCYFCPSCKTRLTRRAGQRRPHFAHRPSMTCSGESVIHQIAKLLVKQVFESARTGGRAITLVITCAFCFEEFSPEFPLHSANMAQLEGRLQSGRIADVLLSHDDEPRLAIEIFASHAVDEVKASALDIPWIELEAKEIVANAHRWRARAFKLHRKSCHGCRMRGRFWSKLRDMALQNAALTHLAGYEVEPAPCWKCQQVIPIFFWGVEVPEEKPETLVRRKAPETGQYYWMNSCPHCHALQALSKVRHSIERYRIEVSTQADRFSAKNLTFAAKARAASRFGRRF